MMQFMMGCKTRRTSLVHGFADKTCSAFPGAYERSYWYSGVAYDLGRDFRTTYARRGTDILVSCRCDLGMYVCMCGA